MKLRGAKVLITGAGGFIGSHLTERLIAEGCKVRAFVHYNSLNSWGWLDALSNSKIPNLEVISGDIRDQTMVRKTTQGVDIVFHLAALIAIPYSYYSPESYLDTNVRGTLNLLEAARESCCKRILTTSTSEVYGTAQYVPIDEKHPNQGQSPYSATKIAADKLAESFLKSFGLPVTVVRPFNTYGPRQSARAIIPTIITQLLSGQKKIKLGALNPTRDFTFVKDTAEAFLAIAASNKTIGEEINISSQTEVTIGVLAKRLIKILSPRSKIVSDELRFRPQKSEVERLLGSNEKIKRLTNWKPTYNLDTGLTETLKWFKEKKNRDYYKSDIYNV